MSVLLPTVLVFLALISFLASFLKSEPPPPPQRPVKGGEDELSLYQELLGVCQKERRKLSKVLRIRRERDVLEFCCSSGYISELKHDNLCKLAFVLVNVLGKPLPDHVHARIVLGASNEWAGKYVEYSRNLKPPKFGFLNVNKNLFHNHRLGDDGYMVRMTWR